MGREKVRFDIEQIIDDDNARLNTNRTRNTYRFRGQQQANGSSLNISPRKRTETIRVNEALDILETYYVRCKNRCFGKIQIT